MTYLWPDIVVFIPLKSTELTLCKPESNDSYRRTHKYLLRSGESRTLLTRFVLRLSFRTRLTLSVVPVRTGRLFRHRLTGQSGNGNQCPAHRSRTAGREQIRVFISLKSKYIADYFRGPAQVSAGFDALLRTHTHGA